MELCSSGHDEVCYEANFCPACEVKGDMEGVIANRDKEIEDQEAQIKDLSGELSELKEA